MTARIRDVAGVGIVLILVALLLTGFEAGPSQGAGSDVEGPHVGPPAAAAVVDLAWLPRAGEHHRAHKPFFHHRGHAELDREKAEAEQHGLGARTQPAPALSLLQPSTGLGFNGINAEESFCNCYPPDGAVAVSDLYILAAVNTAMKVWDKKGKLLVGPKSLPAFFSYNPGCLHNVSDPFAGYDVSAGQFMIGALTYDNSYNSTICIAVTGDPTSTGVWYLYAFPVTPASNLLDFPHVAIGSDAIYLAGNQFLSGAFFAGARVYAYDKRAMYAGNPASYRYYNVGSNAAGHTADSLYPAQGVPSAAYFISADNCGGCNTISLWKWSNPFAVSSSFALRGGVKVTTYSQPPNAKQLGGSRIATNDVRNLGGYWSYSGPLVQGTVYGTHAIGCNPGSGTVACVQWYQIKNLDSGTPALVQQGILSSNGQYRYYPNLAVDNLGNMIIAYAYSSSSYYAGIRYTGRLAGDLPGALQPEAVLKAGEAPINGGRYGDYAGTVLDPDGHTVWHFEEYAKRGSLWGTWAGAMSF